MSKVDNALKDRLAFIVDSMGYEFVGCEIHPQDRRLVLRIYIDSTEGIRIEDCSKVSRQISAVLSVEDPIQGHYVLEVSSPGLDKPLFEIDQYERVINSRIKIKLNVPIEDRRNFTGFLLKVDGSNVTILVDGKEIVVPFSHIEKGNVVADMSNKGG